MRKRCGRSSSIYTMASGQDGDPCRLRGWSPQIGATVLIRAWQPADSELDPIAWKDAPRLNLSHIGRFRKAAKHLARFLARGLARERESLASKRVALVALLRKDLCRPACDVGGTTNGTHERLAVRNVSPQTTARESTFQIARLLAASAMAASASASRGKPAAAAARRYRSSAGRLSSAPSRAMSSWRAISMRVRSAERSPSRSIR